MPIESYQKIKEALDDLIEDTAPNEWISWLYDQLTAFISRSHNYGMNETGAAELANRYHSLKHFFENINNISK